MAETVKLFTINSKDRLKHSASTTDCKFIFNAINATSCDCVSFLCPMTQYNINDTNNLVYFNDGAPHNFNITSGNYSVYDFIAELQTQFNSVSAGYLVTYSNVSMKLTITNSVTPFQLLFGSNIINTSAYIMGFNNVDTALAITHSSNNCIDLSLPLLVHCSISQFGENVDTTNNSASTFVFTNKVNCSEILIYEEATCYRQCTRIYDHNIQSINVRLTTSSGNLLDINGSDWTMILRMHYC